MPLTKSGIMIKKQQSQSCTMYICTVVLHFLSVTHINIYCISHFMGV